MNLLFKITKRENFDFHFIKGSQRISTLLIQHELSQSQTEFNPNYQPNVLNASTCLWKYSKRCVPDLVTDQKFGFCLFTIFSLLCLMVRVPSLRIYKQLYNQHNDIKFTKKIKYYNPDPFLNLSYNKMVAQLIQFNVNQRIDFFMLNLTISHEKFL